MKRLLAIAVFVAACGNSPQPSGSNTPPLPTLATAAVEASPSLAASTAPTPDSEAVRKAAAAAYLKAAETSNKAGAALAAKYKTFANLSKARSYYRAYAAIDGAFVKALKKIAVPTDTKADMHSLIAKVAADQALAVEGSGVKSWTEQESLDAALVKAARVSSAAANLVRSDLGLPPVHL